MTPLDGAVELLDRALAYTRVALSDVTDADLGRRTPCPRWDLGQLLAHMEDALDAFGEGSTGSVALEPRVPARVRTSTLQEKACALLGAWSTQTPARVEIGGHAMDTHVAVLAAALEITVHGWDVAQATGSVTPVPADLARRLLAGAEALVVDADRGDRFGPARPVDADAPDDQRLLGFMGRGLDQAGQNPRDTGPDRRTVS